MNKLRTGSINIRYIKTRKLEWLGHIRGIMITEQLKESEIAEPVGKKIRGRLRKTWMDGIDDDLRRMNKDDGRLGKIVQ